jgi:cell division protein FtsB
MNSENKPLWKQIVSIAFLLMGIIVLIQSGLSLYHVAQREDRVWQQRERLRHLEQEQDELKKQLSRSYTEEYIEEEARNKLGLVKPGETLIFLEKDASEASFLRQGSEADKDKKTILQQWWEVFF